MKKAVYQSIGTIAVTEQEPRELGPEEVAIEVAYTGICGTDLHVYHGHMDGRVTPGEAIGHEMSGRIVSVGSAVTEWRAGQHVTVMPLDWCGECLACRRGHWHVCQRLNFIGIDSAGAMQERWIVPQRTIIPLPQDLPMQHAALVEPTAVAVHDVRRSGVRPGDKALVIGAGPVGTLIALVAQNAGAEVRIIETNPFRIDLARQLGLKVFDAKDAQTTAAIDAWTEGGGVDVAFEVSGAAAGLDSAISSLAVRGTLCLVAVHTSKPPADLHRIFWRELNLVGARLYDRDDFVRGVELVAAGVIPASAMISAVFPLDEAAEAFVTLESGAQVMKVLVGNGLEGEE